MAKIPDLNSLGARPSPQPTLAVTTYRGDNPAATAPGEALFATGGVIRETGDRLFAAGKAEEERRRVAAAREKAEREAEAREMRRIDELRAEDAFSALRERQLDLTVGEQNGYMRLRGSAAVTRPLLQEWSAKFDEAAKEIEASLGNDQQRAFFRRRSGVGRLQYIEGILQHMLREGDVFERQNYDGTIATELKMVTAEWDQPAVVAASIERVDSAARTFAKNRGLAPELAEAERLRALSTLHGAVISQAVANGQFRFAETYYEQHKGQFDEQTARAVSVAVRDGTQREIYNGYSADFLAQRDSRTGLDALIRTIEADKTLDDTRKNALLGRVSSRLDTLETKARIERDQRMRVLERQIDTVNNLTLRGYEPTPEQLAPLVNATRGTALEPQVRQMVATANATRQFRLAPPQAQEAYITSLEAEARANPGKFDVTVLDRFKTIHENQKREARADPVTFAVRQGLADPTTLAAKPLDLTKPETLGDQLAARMGLAREMATRYRTELKPATEAETDALKGFLAGATAQQKLDYFGKLAGAAKGDLDGYKALMAQVAPDDPVTAVAGVYASRPASRGAAQLILQGQEILRPNRRADGQPAGGKVWPMPPEREMQTWFDNVMGTAYTNAALRNAHFQSAQAAYAALITKSANQSGVLDTTLWRDAIRQATGGVVDQGGQKLIPPYGMNQAEFRDGLHQRLLDAQAQGRLDPRTSAAALLNMPLVLDGDGQYFVRSGDSMIKDQKTGQPLIIDFNRGATAAPPTFQFWNQAARREFSATMGGTGR